MNGTPLVSVCCITYNHALYIKQCLEGFLMQKTNFSFEIIINDDCSTDGTTKILKEYAERYSDVIKPIFHEENQYSKGVRGILVNFVFPKVQGKYVAICEGDDYWTDPYKLQKQVDFLENHLDYSMCFHNASILNETNEPHFPFIPVKTADYTANEIYENWIVPTASIVFRKKVLESLSVEKELFSGDINLILTCASLGRVHAFKERMSVYRVQETGLTIARFKENRKQNYLKEIEQAKFLKKKFTILSELICRKKCFDNYKGLIACSFTCSDFFLYVSCAFKLFPIETITFLFRKAIKKMLQGLM